MHPPRLTDTALPAAARRNDQKVGQKLPLNTLSCSQPWYRLPMQNGFNHCVVSCAYHQFVCRFVVTFSPLSSMVEWVLRCKIECWIRLYHYCRNKKCTWRKTRAGMPHRRRATRQKSTAISNQNITAKQVFVLAVGGHYFCVNAWILDYVSTTFDLATLPLLVDF